MKLVIKKNTLISAEQEPDERELIVPDGVKVIAPEGLAHLPLIERIVLPGSVRTVGERALLGDVRLRELTLPVTATFQNGAFCTMQEFEHPYLETLTLTLPEDKDISAVKSTFGKHMLSIPAPHRLVFAPGFLSIPDNLFPYLFWDVQTLEFSEGLTSIGRNNFASGKALTKIVFPSSLRSIEAESFRNAALLREVVLPVGCRVYQDAFKSCGTVKDGKKLAKPDFAVRFAESRASAVSLPGVELKTQNGTIVSAAADDFVGHLAVPEGVHGVGREGLAHLPLVEKITLPDSVSEIGSHAFAGDTRLRELSYPVTAWLHASALHGIDGWKSRPGAFKYALDCVTLTAPRGRSIQLSNFVTAFQRISRVRRIVLAEGISAIADRSMSSVIFDAEELEFSEGLLRIGEGNFCENTRLRKIVFPSTLKRIDARSFCDLPALHEVRVPGRCQIDPKAFQSCGTREHGRELPAPRFEIIRE